MSSIRSYNNFENNYHEISELCHENSEPVIITKNGVEDLAIMSMEVYRLLSGKMQLYSFLEEGLNQVEQGKTKPLKKSIQTIRTKIEQQCIT